MLLLYVYSCACDTFSCPGDFGRTCCYEPSSPGACIPNPSGDGTGMTPPTILNNPASGYSVARCPIADACDNCGGDCESDGSGLNDGLGFVTCSDTETVEENLVIADCGGVN